MRTIFLSEGAGVNDIVAEMQARGEEPERDAFGHVKIDKINPGEWFAKRFAKMLGAEKVLVQKSGYFARSAAANREDMALIKTMVKHAVKSGLKGESGVVGHDEGRKISSAPSNSLASRAARLLIRRQNGSPNCSRNWISQKVNPLL